jgi:hypothetical protein
MGLDEVPLPVIRRGRAEVSRGPRREPVGGLDDRIRDMRVSRLVSWLAIAAARGGTVARTGAGCARIR